MDDVDGSALFEVTVTVTAQKHSFSELDLHTSESRDIYKSI